MCLPSGEIRVRWGLPALTLVVLIFNGCQTASHVKQTAKRMAPDASRISGDTITNTTLPIDEISREEDSPVVQASAQVQSLGDGTAVKESEFQTDHKPDDNDNPNSTQILALRLDTSVAMSLAQNPDLTTIRGQEEVSAALVDVAATYPWNPFVQSQLLPGTGGTNSTQTSYYVWLMQRFELAHQKRHREESAGAALNQVRWNIHQAELLNITQTLRLHFAALYQRELRDLSVQTAKLNEELSGVVGRRFKAGLSTAAEVTTAEVSARQTSRQADLAEATYQAAVLALRQQINDMSEMPLRFDDRLTDYEFHAVARACEMLDLTASGTTPGQGMAAALIEGRPDVLAAMAGIDVASANEQLARAGMIPDVQAGPILNTLPNGAETVGVRFQMDLPVWNNGSPLVRQRQAERRQQFRTFEQLKTRATLEAQNAINRYERARLLAGKSRVDLASFDTQIPRELQSITTQFEAGQADVLAVFATQNSLIQERRTYLDLLNELAQSAAGVIQATGIPVTQLISVSSTH